MRRTVIAILAGAAILGVAAAAMLVTIGALSPPFGRPQDRRTVEVRVEALGTPEENDVSIAQPLEHLLRDLDVKEIHSISGEHDVRVRLAFPKLAPGADDLPLGAVRGRVSVATHTPTLPVGTAPTVHAIEPLETVYLQAAAAADRAFWSRQPGVREVRGCSEAEEPHTEVRVRLDRLDALGLDLTNVYDALVGFPSHGVGPAAAASRTEAVENGFLLRASPPVALKDVGTVSLVEAPVRCHARDPAGSTTLLFTLGVQKGSEAALLDLPEAKRGRVLRGSQSLAVRVRLASEVEERKRSAIVWDLADRMRSVKGAAMFVVLARDLEGEIVFEQSKPPTPKELDELRAVIEHAGQSQLSAPGTPTLHTLRPLFAWAGVSGNVGAVRRVEVSVPADAKLPFELEPHLRMVAGVRTITRDSEALQFTRRVVLDPKASAAVAASPASLAWAIRVASSSEPVLVTRGVYVTVDGESRFGEAKVKGRPLSELTKRELADTHVVVERMNRRPARVFELEVEDASVVRALERSMAGVEGATVALVD